MCQALHQGLGIQQRKDSPPTQSEKSSEEQAINEINKYHKFYMQLQCDHKGVFLK